MILIVILIRRRVSRTRATVARARERGHDESTRRRHARHRHHRHRHRRRRRRRRPRSAVIMPTLMHTIAKNTYISSWRSRECMTMARATTDDRSSLVNHPPSARLEKKRKSPGVLTVCCNHRESNPGLFYIETRRLRQYAFRVRVLWAPRTERRIATLDIGLVHVPPAYCSCENRERV